MLNTPSFMEVQMSVLFSREPGDAAPAAAARKGQGA